jgi:hypothetical protein
MKSELLIAGTTLAVTSKAIQVNENSAVTLAASGLGTGESIDLQVSVAGTWVDVYQAGNQITLSVDDTLIYVLPVGLYRLVKPITVADVAVTAYNING